MDVNQFAVYQLKNIPENRQIRFRPYSALQEKEKPGQEKQRQKAQAKKKGEPEL